VLIDIIYYIFVFTETRD